MITSISIGKDRRGNYIALDENYKYYIPEENNKRNFAKSLAKKLLSEKNAKTAPLFKIQPFEKTFLIVLNRHSIIINPIDNKDVKFILSQVSAFLVSE